MAAVVASDSGGSNAGSPASSSYGSAGRVVAVALLAAGLLLLGDKLPAAAYGTMFLVLLYLLITHAGEFSGVVNRWLAALSQALS